MQNLKVITSQERIRPFSRAQITQSIMKETQELAPRFFNVPGLGQEEAESVALSVEKTLRTMPYPFLTGPLIREVVNSELLLRGHVIHRNILTRVGTPVYDACLMDVGRGKEDKENANLQDNAETSHKKKADRMSKEQYLLLLPPKLSQRHLTGDLHIHDLEYFGTRPFCQDHDLRYFFYYGLMPDGKGQKAAVAGPAKRPEVAILHAVKALGSAQTNFAGGQGYYNFLTFVAPYLEKLPYSSKDPKIMSIKQLMQMFVYEMTQMMVARGGQLVFSSVQLTPGVPKVWKDRPVVAYGKIWDGQHEEERWTYGELEPVVRLAFKALMEVFLEGDAWGKPFSFPKPEIVLSKEFMSDPQAEYWKDHQYYGVRVPTREELYTLVAKLAIIYGSPYFDNEIPEYRNADGEGITCYQCITGDTLLPVHVQSGMKLIRVEDLSNGDILYTPQGYSEFDGLLVQETDTEILKITLKGGRSLRCTKDHEIAVDGIKRKASNLNIGDEIKILNTLPDDGEEDLDLCYFAGLYAAEGNILIRDTNVGGHRLQLSFGEENLAKRACNLITKLFDVTVSCKVMRGNEYRVLVYSKDLCQRLISLGFATKTGKGGRVPEFVFTASLEGKLAFLQGYYQGDGCLSDSGDSKLNRITIETVSEELAEGVLLLASSLGYNFSIYRVKGRDNIQLALQNIEEVKDFLGGKIRPSVDSLPISKIEAIQYKGKVYDPIDVIGHEFYTGMGLAIGNCCSYQFSARPEDDPDFQAKMNFEDGMHFSMGGFQVVTGNMPRAAMKARAFLIQAFSPIENCWSDDGALEIFMGEVKQLMDSAVEIFQQKKVWMEQALAADRIPFATQRPRDPYTGKAGQPLVDFDQLVYAFGIVGMNEVAKILTGCELSDPEERGWDFAMKAVYLMKQYCQELSQKHGIHMVLARTPAETVAQRFAALDLDSEFKDLAMQVVNGNVEEALQLLPQTLDVPVYYTNGAMLKMSAPRTVKYQVEREGQFFPLVDGGNIMHLFVDDCFPLISAHFDRQADLQQKVRAYREAGDPKMARYYEKMILSDKLEDKLLTQWAGDLWQVIKEIASTSDVGYFAFTRDISVCLDCASTIKGRVKECPVCGSSAVDVITRVTGYCQAVSGFNAAKRQEVEDRYRHNASSFGMEVKG